MLTNPINWQSSITRSVRGNSSYGFLNQVFADDVDKLKIETLIINKSRQVQILDSIITIVYQENIDDDIFSIPVGDTKPLIRVIENIKPFPFKLLFQNRNESPLRLTVQKPKIARRRFLPNTSTMPLFGQDDTAVNALIAATNANTAAITAMASANPSADQIADAIANNSVITEQPEVVSVGTSLISILAKSLNTQAVSIKNTSNAKIKIWISDTVPTLTPAGTIIYSTPGETVEIPANTGLYEVPENMCKSGIYAIANNANGKVSVTRTYTN